MRITPSIAARRPGWMLYLEDLDFPIPCEACHKNLDDVYGLDVAGYHTMRLKNGVGQPLKVSHRFIW